MSCTPMDGIITHTLVQQGDILPCGLFLADTAVVQ